MLYGPAILHCTFTTLHKTFILFGQIEHLSVLFTRIKYFPFQIFSVCYFNNITSKLSLFKTVSFKNCPFTSTLFLIILFAAILIET